MCVIKVLKMAKKPIKEQSNKKLTKGKAVTDEIVRDEYSLIYPDFEKVPFKVKIVTKDKINQYLLIAPSFDDRTRSFKDTVKKEIQKVIIKEGDNFVVKSNSEEKKGVLKNFFAKGQEEEKNKVFKDIDNANEEEKVEFRKLFKKKAEKILKDIGIFGTWSEEIRELFVLDIYGEMYGLDFIDTYLLDPNIEDFFINTENDLWLVHKKYGDLKTNYTMKTKEKIEAIIEKIGIRNDSLATSLDPILDGSYENTRVNATLQPISFFSPSITMRKFKDDPYTLIDLIKMGTLTSEIASFIWHMTQWGISAIFSGGTGSGKTTTMISSLIMIPKERRILTIEDTREIHLPKDRHWLPMLTRKGNQTGQGEVTMEDLLVDALRKRPKYIVLGEARSAIATSTLFESIHTGHYVYATFHANNSEEALRRLLEFGMSKSTIASVDALIFVRNQRKHSKKEHRYIDVRKISEISEIDINPKTEKLEIRKLYEYNSQKDSFKKVNKSKKIMSKLMDLAGMSEAGINTEIKRKQRILDLMVQHDIRRVDEVADIISVYDSFPDECIPYIKNYKKEAKE